MANYRILSGSLLLLACGIIWGKQICCPNDKCYSNSEPFDNMPLPSCQDVIQPSMRLFTRSNPNKSQLVTRTTIPPAYMAGKPVVFIVHGYMNWVGIWWMDDIRDAFLRKYDYNIILTSWPKGAFEIDYRHSASNTRVVGAQIAHVARHLVERGVADRNSTWCSGHSLGSHVCGHAGQNYKFGRVTDCFKASCRAWSTNQVNSSLTFQKFLFQGMDPAGPWFQDKDWSVGLNPSVANFVDVWHTNGDTNLIIGFGTLKKLGHVDFYPNGGGFQKGCIIDPHNMNRTRPEDFVGGSQTDLMPVCSHMRATVYFQDAIDSDCQMYARQFCIDESNIPESCFECEGEDGICGVMGMDADKFDQVGFPLYLTTNGARPFCVG